VNDKPCSSCQFYAPIVVGDGKKKTNRRGWCKKKSEYRQQPDKPLPPGVTLVPPEALRSKPKIVIGAKVQRHCVDFKPFPTR
jgi:hypothetical protein